jgi:type IV pilus assembly protein PilO
MNEIKLTKEQLGQIVAGVLFGGLFIYGYLFYFWLPTAKTIEVNTKKVAAMESDINKARMQKAKYKDLESKLASLRAEKEAAEKKLPRDRKLPDLLRTITALSRKYRVDIQSITPSGTSPVEYFTRTSYIISLKGNYHDVGRFLTALGLEERIMTSENLNLSGTPSADTSVNAQFTLVAYQYNG